MIRCHIFQERTAGSEISVFWKLRSDYMGIPHRQDVLDLILQVRKQ